MEKSRIKSLLPIVSVITFVFLSTSFKLAMAASGNETDRLALLAMKDQLVDGGLLSWNGSLHFCEWQGVRCGRRRQRVVGLSLPGMKLGGTISPSIGNMSFLREANFFNNSLKGNIPSELGQLRQLRSLNLSHNNLQGGDLAFLSSLSNCTRLKILAIHMNRLSGVLPDSRANLSAELETLFMGGNRISGNIPDGIGDLVKLTHIHIGENLFTGNVPTSIGKLRNVGLFDLSLNRFSGEIPSCIGNLSLLSHLYLNGNNFEGRVPLTLGQCTLMEVMDLSMNKLDGGIPNQLVAGFERLITLNLSHNSFNGSFDVSNSKNLVELYVDNNDFSGEIPERFGEISELRILHMQGNHFHGSIPRALASLRVLAVFIATVCWKKRPGKETAPSALRRVGFMRVSYKELVEATNEQVEEILDYRLIEQINEKSQKRRGEENIDCDMLECLVSFANIGIACSVEVPVERMKIEDAVTELHTIKARLHAKNQIHPQKG
ncbi:hypothetical protein V6N11_004291 [Hibiscus sabdariffa]|uniref:Leucine-rich repeat-containing N-terminal plant-type domain-containing protein n=1 Tax=Hibiscus sabdariffa TaxID=183260 RepID=A0ABR2SGR9_9ROSI